MSHTPMIEANLIINTNNMNNTINAGLCNKDWMHKTLIIGAPI